MKFVLLFILFLSHSVSALDIPRNLSQQDRDTLIRVLGLSTSSKLTTKPYPLGGYDGFEVSLSVEIIDVTEIGRLGDTTAVKEELVFPRITIGKGLYDDVDVFISFSPFDEDRQLSEYGAILRWSFWELQTVPVNFSIVTHTNVLNFNDSYVNRNFGGELLVGLTLDEFSLYVGYGAVTASGKFMGGAGEDSIVGETNLTNVFEQSISSSHSYLGLTYTYSKYFVAFQFDVYEEPVYGAKLGLLF